jgi:hypothetical protein
MILILIYLPSCLLVLVCKEEEEKVKKGNRDVSKRVVQGQGNTSARGNLADFGGEGDRTCAERAYSMILYGAYGYGYRRLVSRLSYNFSFMFSSITSISMLIYC